MENKWQAILERCECDKGWYGIVTELMDKIKAVYQEHNISMQEDFEILQIKEKFGELIVYTKSSLSNEIAVLVEEARLKSHYLCEECGEDGHNYPVKHFKWYTLCEKCMGKEEHSTFED